MRAVELAKVAAAAEALRLRRMARRQAVRVAYGAVSIVFAIAVLVVVHVLGWNALQPALSPTSASLVVLMVDAVIMVGFGVMALRGAPDSVELEAKRIREQALIEMRQSLTVMSIVAGVTGTALRTGVRQGVRRGITSAFVDGAMRLVRRRA